MKMPESGMPDQAFWESLFDPEKFVQELGITSELNEFAEFGCGYGTFTLPIAKVVSGNVYAMDLEPEMLKATYQNALSQNINNITLLQCDFMSDGAQLSSESVDGALIAHILHGTEEQNLTLLQEAHRILRPGGVLYMLHWRGDVETPRGPPKEMRLSVDQAIALAKQAGFSGKSITLALGEFHWGASIQR